MQFSKIFSTLLVGVLAGIQVCNAQAYSYRVSAEPKDKNATLNTNFQQVSYVLSNNSGAYIGNVKFQMFAEPMIVIYNPASEYNFSSLRFLTYHAERYQDWYISNNTVKPLGLTTWQSIPEDSVNYGFVITDNYIGWKTEHGEFEDGWALCPSDVYSNSFKINWVPKGMDVPESCVPSKLKATPWGACTAVA